MTKKVYRKGIDVRTKVRCLGPREAEHWFWSANPKAERICRACRLLQQQYSTAHEYAVELPRR